MRHSTYPALFGALLGALAVTSPAGAQQPAADPLCDTMHAVQSSALDVADGVASWTVTARPGCEGHTVTLAAHRTAFLVWNADEVQALAGSSSALLAATAVTVRLELPALSGPGGCNWQLDGVAGEALEVVDGSHRYNEFAIGGSRNRLVVARYVAGECADATPPATQPEALPPAEVPPVVEEVPGPPAEATSQRVERVTPTTVPVEVVTPPAVPTLPQTGGRAVWTALVGFVALVVGSVLVLAVRWRERRRAGRVLRDLPPGRGWAGLIDDVGRVG